MEHLVRDPALRTRVYHLKAEGMAFKVTVVLRARRVEKWIRGVKRDFLDATTTKCVGLDCEFTNPRVGNQRAAVLQLLVSFETLVFQIIHADEVSQVLKDFLQDGNIRFRGAAIGNDVEMLSPYGIHITSTYDLQKVVPNPTTKPTPSLYDLANYIAGTNLEKKKKMDVAAKGDIGAMASPKMSVICSAFYPDMENMMNLGALLI
ncbi:uncharacterized protein [Lolium perenne]|uniref:uncharacterized protein n=1 Tax=Lolium perenne TaxID=4522 RepID=UPI0021F64F98|nr:uncharacterized protein LOC127329318 [Lolium perenne]